MSIVLPCPSLLFWFLSKFIVSNDRPVCGEFRILAFKHWRKLTNPTIERKKMFIFSE